MTQQIDIALGDGNPLVLSALAELLERDPRFSLVATAATAEGFLGTAMRVPVQIGIIDWNLPSLGGAQLIEVLRAQANAPRIVVYAEDTDDLPKRAMAAGAAAFASRSGAAENLLDICGFQRINIPIRKRHGRIGQGQATDAFLRAGGPTVHAGIVVDPEIPDTQR